MKIIYAIDFEKEIWSLLGLFESTRYVMDTIASRRYSIGKEEIEVRATNVAYCVRQAREYFSSAEAVSLLTSPLLLSYGMLNLAKAVIIMQLPPHSDFGSLFNKHGISVDFSTLGDNISEVNLSFHSYGVFPELTKSLQEPLCKGSSVSLDQLLSQIPDLHDMYSLVYKKSPKTLPIRAIDYGYCSDNSRENDLSEFADGISSLLDALEAKGHFIEFYNHGFSITTTAGAPRNLKEMGVLVKSISGKEFLRISPILNGVPLLLGDITLNYLIVFCYGILARYKAACWGKYTDPNQSPEAELIDYSLQVCRHRFLHSIVNVLLNEEYEFRFYVEHLQKSKKELVDFIYDDLVRKMERDLRLRARGRGL